MWKTPCGTTVPSYAHCVPRCGHSAQVHALSLLVFCSTDFDRNFYRLIDGLFRRHRELLSGFHRRIVVRRIHQRWCDVIFKDWSVKHTRTHMSRHVSVMVRIRVRDVARYEFAFLRATRPVHVLGRPTPLRRQREGRQPRKSGARKPLCRVRMDLSPSFV
jgi:hypothetical protein